MPVMVQKGTAKPCVKSWSSRAWRSFRRILLLFFTDHEPAVTLPDIAVVLEPCSFKEITSAGRQTNTILS